MINEKKVAGIIRQLLVEINEDVYRDGLKETPERVAKMFTEIFSGLQNPKFADFKTFESKTNNDMVIVDKIPFYSICEHHLMPFFGKVSIGYLSAANRTLGLSKFVRLVDYWSHRPNIQEGLTIKIAEELAQNFPNNGVAVVVTARHLCMEMRGAKTHATETKTQCFLGEFVKKERQIEFWERLKVE